MIVSRKLLSASLVVVVSVAVFAALFALPVAAARSDDGNPERSAPTLPFSPTSRYFDPALRGTSGRLDVVVALEASAPVEGILQYMTGARSMPLVDDVRILRGWIDASKIDELESSPHVLAVLKDRSLGFERSRQPVIAPRLPFTFEDLQDVRLAAVERESLTGDAEVAMRDVVNFTGARRAWTELGVDGTGVTIAVVDTGVDFGAFNLGDSSVARDAASVPISFDPDGSTFAWTTIDVSRYTVGAQDFVDTTGSDPLVYVWDYAGLFGGGPVTFLWSDITGTPFPEDMEVTGLPMSVSGFYRFGVLREWSFSYFDLFPVLLIDTTTSGVYDAAYVDLDFTWFAIGFSLAPDWSFSNETALDSAGGNTVASRDMDGDGYADISAGALGWALDIWNLDPTPPASGASYVAPIDEDGDYITMVYDWEGHGTSVAASAAGRESNHPVAGPGTSPGAKIMAVPIFAWFDIIEGWLWAAGFDLVGTTTPRSVPNYGGVYGDWTYTGNHKADIISNSWGSSDWLVVSYFFQWPWYDVLSVFEDALMTPGYAAPTYPGTLMVHAGGNGASGYGTVTEPAWNSLPLTVGASTSLNYTSLPYAGTHYDVMSWSARGPTLFGYPKPDLLQVGAFAYAAAPVWSSTSPGDGFFAFTLFSGTSQATPVTAGSAAVVIDAYRAGHAGATPTPFQVKSILKSTALDLGYDAFVQGAGHIDVYNAAAYALENSGLLTTTPASWDNVRPWLSGPWSSASVFYGAEIGPNPPAGEIEDTSWFAGSVKPGGSTTASFTTTPATGSPTGTIAAVWHGRMAGSIVRTGMTTVLPGLPGSWLEGYGAFEVLPAGIPAGADLMVVRAGMPYTFLDVDDNLVWDNRSRIVVADWVDDGDTEVEPAEISVFNYGFNTGTTSEARVGLPSGRFAGSPLLWFSHVPAPGRSFVPMPYRIEVEFYDRQPWSWISAPNSFTAPATWTGTLTVPSGTAPGVYEGQILVTPTTGNATAVPVSVVVPATIDTGVLSLTMTSPGSTQLYDPSTVLGYFDWRWRYEAGDWKLWFVDVVDPTTVALYAEVAWSGSNTDVDIFSLRPNAIPGDSSLSPYFGSGNFSWNTRTLTSMDWVATTTQGGIGRTNMGHYAFVLHNVLLGDGGAPAEPESLTGVVAAAKLSPSGPVTVEAQPGSIVSIPYTFSTGYDLEVLPIADPQPSSSFPASASPASPTFLAAGASMTIWLNITIPETTADGTYENALFLFGSPFPGAIAVVNVVVNADITPPTAAFTAPAPNAWVRGTTTVSFSASDPNLESAILTYGGTSVDVTGLTSASVNTATLGDGDRTLTLLAVDEAGNRREATLTLKVDNTRPIAVLRSPEAGTSLSGSAGFSFAASDANIDTATLTIGTQVIDVEGASTATANTASIGDGTYTVELAVADLAGNTASDTRIVTVDNADPVVSLESPAADANLRGTATISWTVVEDHVAEVWLVIDGMRRGVTGTTSYSWDTTDAGDGSHTIEVVVVDDAGNEGSATRTVTTDNVAARVSTERDTGFASGLGLGLALAAVVGFVLGFLLGRLRKGGQAPGSMPLGQEPMPPPRPPEDKL